MDQAAVAIFFPAGFGIDLRSARAAGMRVAKEVIIEPAREGPHSFYANAK